MTFDGFILCFALVSRAALNSSIIYNFNQF